MKKKHPWSNKMHAAKGFRKIPMQQVHQIWSIVRITAYVKESSFSVVLGAEVRMD